MLPINFGSIEIVNQYEIKIDDKKYYIIHGDIFDRITKELKWVAQLGDIGYTILIKLNKFVNKLRKWRGKSYYSFSKEIKHKVKKAVSYISDFEEKLAKLAKQKGCDGIMCGHIHHPEIKEIDGVMYYNSGDWVESMSALVYSDKWELIEYTSNED
jgi:UDP-2,3-diacylglucosamine pyrophosphatase LpxH